LYCDRGDDPSVRIAIVGGGGVGTSLAFNLILASRGDEIVLIDPRTEHVLSHLMDFEQVLELQPGASVRAGTQDELGAADLIAVCASTPPTPADSRLAYLAENARILDEIATSVPRGWRGVAIVVTNPVDPLVVRFQARTGLDRRRVLGYTVNDSLRLRTGIAGALGRGPGEVVAWAIGEHGEHTVPLFSRVGVAGEAVRLDPEDEAAATSFLQTWFNRHVKLDPGRTSTWTTGLGACRMIEAIRSGDEEWWPASIVLDGEHGLHGVALTVPLKLGPAGAEAVGEWELLPGERAAFDEAARAVRSALDTLVDERAVRA
jgi:malate dehydrogenase